jgi:D-alanyl-D-alanine dipeptidase
MGGFRWFVVFLGVGFFLSGTLSTAKPLKRTKGSPLRSLQALEKDPDYVDLASFPYVQIELKYATTDNFMGLNMYGPFKKAFLHKDAAVMFRKAVDLLQKEKPGYTFIVFDALRPHSVQWIMWDRVKDTPQRKYVANAEIGSPHNYGMAIDLSLLDEKGHELDMGTPFDSFSEVSEPQLEERFLKEGKLTKAQMENRMILRRVMTGAGFHQLSHEWWHYNGLPEPEIRKKYKIVE